jgi:hypothetical protein
MPRHAGTDTVVEISENRKSTRLYNNFIFSRLRRGRCKAIFYLSAVFLPPRELAVAPAVVLVVDMFRNFPFFHLHLRKHTHTYLVPLVMGSPRCHTRLSRQHISPGCNSSMCTGRVPFKSRSPSQTYIHMYI